MTLGTPGGGVGRRGRGEGGGEGGGRGRGGGGGGLLAVGVLWVCRGVAAAVGEGGIAIAFVHRRHLQPVPAGCSAKIATTSSSG